MKKVLIVAMSFVVLQACSDSDNQPANQNDGIQTIDSNGGLADTAFGPNVQTTDTSKMEDRVDLSKRDTSKQSAPR